MELNLKNVGDLVKLGTGVIAIASATAALVLYLNTGNAVGEDFHTFKEDVYKVHVVASEKRIDNIEKRFNKQVDRQYKQWKMNNTNRAKSANTTTTTTIQ
jgi:hypothetical protein